MRRLLLPIAALLACLALVLGGCGGSGGGSTTSSSTSAGGSAKGTTSGSGGAGTTTAKSGGSRNPSGKGSGSSTGSGTAIDNSIQTFGSAAGGARKAQIGAVAFAFFKAMAARDYAGVCKALAAPNRAQLEAFFKTSQPKGGGCRAALKTLVPRTAPAARKAAAGTLTGVRVSGTIALVLFRPKGGVPSYFVLKREGGAWKAIRVAPGTPLRITTPSGG